MRSPIAVVLLLACCAGTREAVPSTELTLDETRTLAFREDGRVVVEKGDARSLFRSASKRFDAGETEAALARYDALVSNHPTDPLAGLGSYNAGLCAEKLGRYSDAAARFERALALFEPESSDVRDTRFRLAACYEELGRFGEEMDVLSAFDAQKLPVLNRLEALVRRARALEGLGRLQEAESGYVAALVLFRDNEELKLLHGHPMASLAQFRIGEIYAGLFETAPLRMPEDVLAVDLQRKAELFLKAERSYLKAVSMGDPERAVAALSRVGRLYRTFHEQLMAAEVPSGLDEPGRDEYLRVVSSKVRVLLQKGIVACEKNLELAHRHGVRGEWVTETERELEAMQEEMVQASRRLPSRRPDVSQEPEAPQRSEPAPPEPTR